MESFNQNVIKHKTGLLNGVGSAELGNISKACKIMGFSRDTLFTDISGWLKTHSVCRFGHQG